VFRRKPPKVGPETYIELRRLALDAVAASLPAPRADHARVSGVVVDIPSRGGALTTVVSLTDDSTSLYTSVGGGTIGAGAHPSVAAATHALLAAADQHLDRFTAADDTAGPDPANVRLFVLTSQGRRVADVSEDAFWGRTTEPLTPVIAAVQTVISAIRATTPPR